MDKPEIIARFQGLVRDNRWKLDHENMPGSLSMEWARAISEALRKAGHTTEL